MAKNEVNCKNIFKNTEKRKLKKDFNKRWVELINECEKNRTIISK